MKIIESLSDMNDWSIDRSAKGKSIALVPTMGFFHDGHLSLMRHANDISDLVVVSLFVNPIQFGLNEDLDRYPRDLERDSALAAAEKVDVLFVPRSEEMYTGYPQTRVSVKSLSEKLCGLNRPGHFDGVCTVVAKLFNIVNPSIAVFGSKDYQQLAIIKRMTTDLNWNIDIIDHPIVREDDGLAMSSRNIYLSSSERDSALALYKGIKLARKMAGAGVTDPAKIVGELENFINSHDNVAIEYLSIIDCNDLTAQDKIDNHSLLAMAVLVGQTRLIDNSLLLSGTG